MIYFVTTFSLIKSTLEEVDTESPEYKEKRNFFDLEMEKFYDEQNKQDQKLKSKYPEFYEYVDFMESTEHYDSIENLLQDAPANIKKPSLEELDSYPLWPKFNTENLPKISISCWKVDNSRTPIFFNNLDEAKNFVSNNYCDWEEAGFYNFAYIYGLPENISYPQEKQENSYFYSCEEGWLDVNYITHDYENYLSYKGLPIFGDYSLKIG